MHSAVSKLYCESFCADLDFTLEKKFEQMFTTKLQKAQIGKGSKRTAAFNTLRHQKTPRFIVAVVRRAIAAVMRRDLASISDEEDDEKMSTTNSSLLKEEQRM